MSAKKTLSLLLCAVLLVTMLPSTSRPVSAVPVDGAYFDFEASEYLSTETDGTLEVRVYRHGGLGGEVNVAIKAADFLSVYGEDYEILIDGKPMTPVEGTVIDPSQFVYEEDAGDPLEGTAAATAALPAAAGARELGSSSLRAAQAAYLDLPAAEEADTQSAASELLGELQDYFAGSRGAEGVIRFANGEQYHSITVRLLDNDRPDGEKMFLLGLLGTDQPETGVAPNATTYVTISDDEAQEPAVFTLEAAKTVLTQDAPAAEVTVRRTAGLQYFSTAYVSTVSETAPAEAYENLSLKTVAFAPGQETATVTVTGLSFAQGGTFGLRLEAESPDEVQTHYLCFTMEDDPSAPDAEEAEARGVNGKYFGSSERNFGNSQSNWNSLAGGFSSDKNGSDDPRAEVSGDNLFCYNENKGHYSMIYTNGRIDTVGVKQMHFSLCVWGKGTNKESWVEMDSDQTFAGSTASFYHNSDHWWKEEDIPGVEYLWNWGNTDGWHYFKFATRCTGNGNYNHAEATLDWLSIRYARYTFDLQPSAVAMPSYLYDFTELSGGGPKKVSIYRQLGTDENGNPVYADSVLYKPPAVTMKTTGGENIAGFYTNWSGKAVLEAPSNAGNGLYLKGVYFYKGNPYNNQTQSYNGSAYYVAASGDGKVYVDLNRNFVKTLMNKGSIDNSKTADATIYVYPVYGERTAIVNFDYLGCEPDAQGNYGASGFNAKINNLDNCNLSKVWYYDKFQYYSTNLPIGSVVRVSMTPAANRTAAGFCYWYWGQGRTYTWHKQGDRVVTGGSQAYTEVQITDYTKADIPILDNVSMVPVTGAQDLTVLYSPRGFINRPYRETTDTATGEAVQTKDYTNAVIDYSNGVPASMEELVGTDENGSMTLTPIRMGDQIVLMASPPEGYYVSWADMTGDTNGDGVITSQERIDAGNRRRDADARSNNPMYVFGDILSARIDQDNTRYYYEFVKGTTTGTVVSGRIVRQNSTLYDLANNSPVQNSTPVVGAYVNVAGTVGQTNTNGDYAIELEASLPSWGVVSTYYTVDGLTYNSVGYLERDCIVQLPALEQFKARGATASFSPKSAVDKDSVDGRIVTVADGTLRLDATIDYYGAIVPVNAHFTVVDSKGLPKLSCDGAEGYTTTVENLGTGYTGGAGGTFRASLSFNPLKDLSSGDRVFVAFEDASGHIYAAIDLGLQFYSKLSLKELVLPALGPTLTGAYTSGFVTDLIGDPLASIGLGKFTNLGQKTESYTPANIPVAQQTEYTWKNSVFSWKFSKEFAPNFKKGDSDKDKNDKLKASSDAVAAADENALISKGETTSAGDGTTPKQSDGGFNTKGSFKFKITPTVGWQLTLSQRLQADGTVKTFFEDLMIYVKCDITTSTQQIIQTPIGINVMITVTLSGDKKVGNPIITGVYRMYVDYMDTYETEDAVPYDESFQLFKTSNDARRHEGYIFLNPVLTMRLGIGAGIAYIFGEARFAFDMDFHFTGTENECYGRMNISGKWGVQILSFDVYKKDFGDTTVKLFEKNAGGPFGFGAIVNAANPQDALTRGVSDAVTEALRADGETLAPTLIERSYLARRSAWNGAAAPAQRDPAQGSVETTLRSGTAANQQFGIVPFGDGQALAVFVDDAPARSTINSRAVYYTLRDKAGNWSEPQIVYDDGTADDYPYAAALGNGKIMIAWSSSDEVLEDDATFEYALQCLGLQAAFFDTETLTMGEAQTLTHSTQEDYCGDLMPRIAYDAGTDKAILYFTKTEYTDIVELDDVSKAYSVNAYFFYDPATDTWTNTGDTYTDEELESFYLTTEAEKDYYRENWYGQRFLDLRLDSASSTMPCVVDTDAISFNGLALFAYTVDWDEDFTTLNDRDVFLQLYDFERNLFTHIIRITPETGCYAGPKLAHSNNCTYLFYGMNDEASGESSIRVLEIGGVLANGWYEKITNGNNSYYVLQDGNGTPVRADTATVCNSIQDYSAVVAADGKLYLLWTDAMNDESGREIYASIFNNIDGDEEDEAPCSVWSAPVALTLSDDDHYYAGLGAVAENGTLVVLSGKSSYSDPAANCTVQVIHTPFEKVVLEPELTLSDYYAAEGDALSVTATLRNTGLAEDFNGESVTFYVNGEEAAAVSYTNAIPGGGTVEVNGVLEVPAGEMEITARCNGTEARGKLLQDAFLSVENETLGYPTDVDGVPTYERSYSAVLSNTGNLETGAMTLRAAAGEQVLAEAALGSLAPKTNTDAELLIPFDETLYTLDEQTGVAALDVTISVTAGEKELYSSDATLTRQYDADAIAALKTCQSVSGLEFAMTLNGYENLQPTITGNNLRVEWQRSSAPETVWIDSGNCVCAESAGTATLTGLIVPNWTVQEILSDGSYRQRSWSELVPESMLQTVTATVTVTKQQTFEDVPEDAYFADAVDWAVDLDITTGTSETTFSPNNACTRAEAVTFLWRAAGSPEPTTTNNPFRDVEEGKWYYKAVLWASETGVTAGTGETTFSPGEPCTRGQIVTFIWRYAGSPEPTAGDNPFTDVKNGAYYYKAVLWAVEDKVTAGTSATTFSPNQQCTRAQIVTFLYRYKS